MTDNHKELLERLDTGCGPVTPLEAVTAIRALQAERDVLRSAMGDTVSALASVSGLAHEAMLAGVKVLQQPSPANTAGGGE